MLIKFIKISDSDTQLYILKNKEYYLIKKEVII